MLDNAPCNASENWSEIFKDMNMITNNLNLTFGVQSVQKISPHNETTAAELKHLYKVV